MRLVRRSLGTPGPVGGPEEEVVKLRRTVRDLVALSALPSIWVDCDLQRSLQNLTDVLRATLRASIVCLRIELPDGSRFETGASPGLSNNGSRGHHLTQLLDSVPAEASDLVELQELDGGGVLNALIHSIFFGGRQVGYLVAGYRGDVLPAEGDRLITQVAANQVTLLFQRHKDQEERLARKLAEDQLRQTEHHYQQLVQSLPAAVYTCDTAGRVTLYNEAAVALWGRRPKLGEDKWCDSWKIFGSD